MKRINLFFKSLSLIIIFIYIKKLETKSQHNIAVIGAHDNYYDHIGKYAHLNKKEYAKKNDYDAILYTDNIDPKRNSPYWYKVVAIQKHLKDYDWVLWVDSDALIMNYNFRIENILDNKYDIIISRDCLDCINTGNFLVKNSEWAHSFLKKWYDMGNVGITADNGALIKLFQETEDIRNHIKVVSARIMNSYVICPKWYLIDGEYKTGDFIIHFVGRSYEERAKYMKEYFDIIKR